MPTEPRQPRDNAGALFKNTRKKSENHPDYQGEVVIGGREYWISGWARESAQGRRYTSLAFKPKAPKPPYQAPKSTAQARQPTREPGEDDDKGELPP